MLFAYVENDSTAGIQFFPKYEFRLYDDKGIFITRVDWTCAHSAAALCRS